MTSLKSEEYTKSLTKTLTYLEEKKREREQDCDNIMREYGLFTETVVAIKNPFFQSSVPLLTG